MLKRIKNIQNIGRFKSCKASSVQFEKITLIFGRNTYGKSTLGDLLSSLETGNTDAIKSRKTIPNDQQSQQVELSFAVDGQQGELSIKYSNNVWQSLQPTGLKLHIFDDSFYHNNLFAGQKFTRETKDNFSSFVLGLQGVTKSKVIEEKKKIKGDITRDRNSIKESAFKNIDDFINFIQLSPSESIVILQKNVDTLIEEHSKLKKQQVGATKIQERKECYMLNWENDFSDALQKLNITLQKSFQSHHIAARQKVTDHIQLHFKEIENSENWIRQGLKQNNGESCQFCGQNFNAEALHLLDIYSQSFDTAYDEHDKNIKLELKKNQSSLIKDRINSLKIILERNNVALTSYPELEEEYLLLVEEITQLITKLDELFTQWEQHQIQLKKELEVVISKKQALPHKALEDFQSKLLLELNEELAKTTQQYDEFITKVNAIFQKFKLSVTDNSLSIRIAEIISQEKIQRRKLQRLQLAEQ